MGRRRNYIPKGLARRIHRSIGDARAKTAEKRAPSGAPPEKKAVDLVRRTNLILSRQNARRLRMSLTKEHLLWGYRLILDRDPEKEVNLDSASGFDDARALREQLMLSPEFIQNNEKLILDLYSRLKAPKPRAVA
ncbi:hypothetical protein MSC49_21550 [Methylosinus sp. C49]|nr:hypothetical protein MSC49_21550 [Methylosinus sp. C49]